MAREENLRPFTSEQSRDEAVTNGRKAARPPGHHAVEKRKCASYAKSCLKCRCTAISLIYKQSILRFKTEGCFCMPTCSVFRRVEGNCLLIEHGLVFVLIIAVALNLKGAVLRNRNEGAAALISLLLDADICQIIHAL